MSTFEQCRYHAFLEYSQKRAFPATYNRAHAIRGQDVHTAAEKYIRGKARALSEDLIAPLVVTRINTYRTAFENGRVAVEEEWGFNQDWQPTGYFAPDVWLRTKCDVVLDEGDTVEVVDWKTGKRWGNEVKHTFQGMLYSVNALIKYPDADNVRIRFIYTDEGTEKAQTYTRRATMQLLPGWDARARTMTSALEFPPKPNKINCRFCPYAPVVNGGDGFCPVGVESLVAPPKKKRMPA